MNEEQPPKIEKLGVACLSGCATRVPVVCIHEPFKLDIDGNVAYEGKPFIEIERGSHKEVALLISWLNNAYQLGYNKDRFYYL